MYNSHSPPPQLGGQRMGPHMQRAQHRSHCNGAAAVLACLLCLVSCSQTAAAGAELFGSQAGPSPSLPLSRGQERSGGRHILQAAALAAGAAAGGNSSSSAIAEARKGTAVFTLQLPSFGCSKDGSRLGLCHRLTVTPAAFQGTFWVPRCCMWADSATTPHTARCEPLPSPSQTGLMLRVTSNAVLLPPCRQRRSEGHLQAGGAAGWRQDGGDRAAVPRIGGHAVPRHAAAAPGLRPDVPGGGRLLDAGSVSVATQSRTCAGLQPDGTHKAVVVGSSK
jgi:hypothetical protein